MELHKWLKRKYPKSYDNIISIFNDDYYLKELKERKYNIGILSEDIDFVETYLNGSMFMFKRQKEYDCEDHSYYYDSDSKWTGEFEYYCIFKCINPNLTSSGYHSGVMKSIKYEIVSR